MNAMKIVPLICLLASLSACQTESLAPLVASNVEITPSLPGSNMSAAYLALQNTTTQAITISAVRSAEFESVEIHETSVENGIARMRKLSSLTIPAGATITLKRGGIHLMMRRPTNEPQTVTLTFVADSAPLLSVTATVSQRND